MSPNQHTDVMENKVDLRTTTHGETSGFEALRGLDLIGISEVDTFAKVERESAVVSFHYDHHFKRIQTQEQSQYFDQTPTLASPAISPSWISDSWYQQKTSNKSIKLMS